MAVPDCGKGPVGLGRRGVIAVAAIALAYTVVYSALSIWRHSIYNSSMYDLALFDQLIWNMAHGRFFESSIKGFNYLGDHVSPILILLTPLYWIWEDVRILLVFQSAAIAAAAFPFAAAATGALRSRTAGVMMAAVFLLYPNLGYVNLFDFHPEILLVPIFTFVVFFQRRGRPWAAAACALLALTVKEDAAITAACFGLYLFFAAGARAPGAVVATVSAAWFLVAMNVIIPANKPSGASDGYLYIERYAHLGASLPEVLRNALLHPVKALVEPYRWWKGVTALRMFVPVAFLPFVGWPLFLVAVPVLAYSYISSYIAQFDLRFQYVTIAVPFILFAALDGAVFVKKRLDGLAAVRRIVWLSAPRSAVVVAAALLALNGFSVYWVVNSHRQNKTFARHYNESAIREALGLIPKDASVATINTLGPQLAHRRTLEFAVPFEPHWYHYKKLGLPLYSEAEYQLFDQVDARWTARGSAQRISDLKTNLGYETLYHRDRVVLLKMAEGAGPR
ncbi:MAG: DUF2079 domain-containing protein [Deltaproteobacteria bacterium]|nr:DUF2079 domain-containing protein [Deltaproteobacteria bacterium]